MLIILEGPSGTGKTEISERITEEINARYPDDTVEVWRPGPPSCHALDAYVVPLLGYRPTPPAYLGPDRVARRTPGHHVICEGWHWGELVAAVTHGRASTVNNAVFEYIEMFLASRGAYLVNLVRDAEGIADDLKTRGDAEPDFVTVSREITAYSSLAYLTRLDVREAHVEEDGMASAIVAGAHMEEVKAHSLTPFTTYVGPPQPDVLLIGNTRGPGIRDPRTPAFLPYPSTCGDTLMNALVRIPRTSDSLPIALVNGCDVDDLDAVIRETSPRHVVTLGNEAFRCADITGCPSLKHVSTGAHLPHPASLASRYGDPLDLYVRLLSDVIPV